jgi:hypothetical protein
VPGQAEFFDKATRCGDLFCNLGQIVMAAICNMVVLRRAKADCQGAGLRISLIYNCDLANVQSRFTRLFAWLLKVDQQASINF